MKRIGILGSTGSIGTQTLEVVRANKEELKVISLCAGTNIDQLEQQIYEFSPELVALWDKKRAEELKIRVKHLPVKVYSGMEGLIACSTEKSIDIVVGAMVGMIGILPTVEAIKAGKDIALANKETLVTAGHIIMPLAAKNNVRLLPVDSEHSAIFQCINGEEKREIEKLILTASGGPFRGKTREELKNVRVEDALRHPNWEMGKKITIDSSTMVNKGLEVIEAKWLFDVDFHKIEVVIQPQSVIHSMVAFQDGAVMAQMGTPDMRLPIQYALFYPSRMNLEGERLDFTKLNQITFEQPDLETFQGLKLAYEAGKIGGSMPTVYNAANEMAVEKFLKREISYLEIQEIIAFAMENHNSLKEPTIQEILEIENEIGQIINNKWR